MVSASAIGKPIKVDLHTLQVAKGHFARVCVEIDLHQPVVGKVGLHIIYARCGYYGHVLKDCKVVPPVAPVAASAGVTNSAASPSSGISIENPCIGERNQLTKNEEEVVEVLHGDWLLVSRKKCPLRILLLLCRKSREAQLWG